MNGWRKIWKQKAALLWALLLTVSLILGGCGADSGAVQSVGEEILNSIAGDMDEGALESAAKEIGNDIVRELADNILGTAEAESAGGDGAAENTGADKETESTGAGEAAESGRAEDAFENAGAEESAENSRTDGASESDPAAESHGSGQAGETAAEDGISVEFGGEYSDCDHVALYIHLYGELPSNYITKNEARDLGWDSGKGNLWEIAPGMSIGGDYFGNREGLLPKKKGRSYYECDINYEGGYRGGERIVFSDDGLVYYSEDHYANFELLYDEEGPVK